jgi:lipopolysaccharide export system permease protein
LLLLRTGNFHDISNGLTFYARDRGKEGDLRGLMIHDTRKDGKPSTIMAESGELIRTDKGPNVLVKNGVRQELDSATGLLSQLSFKSYLVDLTTVNDNFSTRWREPRERSMVELLTPEGTDKDPITVGRFIAEFHLRLTMPFLAVTFALIACVTLLTGQYNRRGMMQKIIIAGLAVVALESSMLSILNLIAKNDFLVIVLYVLSFGPLPFLVARLKGRST